MKVWRRLTLRRADGAIYLDRWGVALDRVGGIMLHRMTAPDPGVDLHDHPWAFATVVLRGGYFEERALSRVAPALAGVAEQFPETCTRGVVEERRRWRPRLLRLDECHRVFALDARRSTCWTLVVRGPTRRRWGFYLPTGYMDERTYDETVRAERRDLWSDQAVAVRPWEDAG